MKSPKTNDTFKEISQLIWQHLADRDWDNPTERALAISLSLEANELLEHYQWQEKALGNREELAEELADILIYALQFAHVLGIDPAEAIRYKLAASAQKYPAEHYKGKDQATQKKLWIKAKLDHRQHKQGL